MLFSYMDKKARKTIGKQLFSFISYNRDLIKNSEKKGYLFVSKDSKTKGEQSFDKTTFSEFREIAFIKDKELRKSFGKLARKIGFLFKNHFDNQFGFLPKTSINDLQRSIKTELNDNKVIYSLDLSNAFGQICYKQLRFYLRKHFYLNSEDATILANSMTEKGFMYQGHPLSPLFFNYHLQFSLNRLKGLCDRIFAYADDINLVFKNKISRRLKNLIHKILEENHLRVNKKKCKFLFIKNGIKFLGFNFRDNWFKAKNLSKLKRKANYFEQLNNRGIIPNKSNNVNLFKQKMNGIRNFIKDMELGNIIYQQLNNGKQLKFF